MTSLKSESGITRRILIWLSCIILVWHCLLLFGLPNSILFAIWLALSLWLFRVGNLPAIATTIAIVISIIVLEVFAKASGLEKEIYYRPHELMASSNHEFGKTFRPNTIFSMPAKFGDIEALEQSGVREPPHDISYTTDSLGFRNPHDYANQEHVFVGDSFLAGANDTQSCIITEWLRNDHKIDAYNIAYPGDMNDYVQKSLAFRKMFGADFRLSVFVFEGNDFIPFSKPKVKKTGRFHNYSSAYKDFFHSRSLWRYTRWLYLRGSAKQKASSNKPLVANIGKLPVAFLSTESSITKNRSTIRDEDLRFSEAFNILKPNISNIFFIPTKYRVYSRWLGDDELPNAQLEYLKSAASKIGVPVHDLTPTLISAATVLIEKGEYVYWRDDTHWNCNGMRAASSFIAKQLSNK